MTNQTRVLSLILSFVIIGIPFFNSSVHADEPWELMFKTAPAHTASSQQFGSAVAISGNLAIVGVPNDDEYGPHSGSAYIFEVSTGRRLFKINATDQSAYDYFGSAVAVDGRFAVIGAPFHRNRNNSAGSAYVFDITTGRQISKLRNSDKNGSSGFGSSVAISGNHALVGAPDQNNNGIESGAAYLFNTTNGRQLHKLQAPDGTAGDGFGAAVALNRTTAIIGADDDDTVNGLSSGSAYLFDVTTGRFISLLLPDDGEPRDQFGFAVAVSADLAVIGSRLDDDNGNDSGSAYVFNITTGEQVTKLLAYDGTARDSFGISVAVNGNTTLIGATGNDEKGYNSGSAYLFETTTGKPIDKLIAPDGNDSARFALAVALAGNNAIIGATGDNNTNGYNSGSAYFFHGQYNDNFLTITPTPLIAGRDGTFTISGTLPNEKTWLIYSRIGVRQKFIRKLNVVIDLAHPKLVTRPEYTDEVGDLQFVVKMPRKRKWHAIWFQAIQRENITNYIATQILP